MSKSRGNVVNPDDIIEEWGADTLRCYEMFLGPLEENKVSTSVPWLGVFAAHAWRSQKCSLEAISVGILRMLHRIILLFLVFYVAFYA